MLEAGTAEKGSARRSRLIAQGLKFAQSPSAREAIEKLLSDFTVVPSRTAPLMPVYRLEVEEELPRIIPLAGSLPLKKIAFEQITALAVQEPFRAVQISGNVTVVPVPGWQVMLKAIDPIGIFCLSDRLPKSLGDKPEQVLVVVDRQVRDWDVNAYFLIEQEGQLELRWFEEPPELQLLGQVILILRPKKILDENNLIEPWQMDD